MFFDQKKYFGVKREDIDKEWLKTIYDDISQGKITIKEASKHVHFITDNSLTHLVVVLDNGTCTLFTTF